LALSLGVGAAAAVWSVVDTALLATPPYRQPERLVMLQGSFTSHGEVKPWPSSQMDLADWRQQSTAFAGMSALGKLGFNLEAGQRSRRLDGELVNAGYFELLGVHPLLGRFFAAGEDLRPFDRYVVVLGYDLWQSALSGDPRAVGSDLRLNGQAYRVIGVAPRGFRGLSDQAALWVPSMLPPIRDYLIVRRERWLGGIARLRPGVTVQQAQADLNRITAGLARQFPNMNQGMGVTVTPVHEAWFGALAHDLRAPAAAAGALLLAAVINTFNLFAGRRGRGGRGRTRGAARREGLWLGLAAGLGGGLLAMAVAPSLGTISGPLPAWVHIAVWPLTGLLTVVTAVACAAVAALVTVPRGAAAGTGAQAGHEEGPAAANGAPASRGGRRRRRPAAIAMAVIEVALALWVTGKALAAGRDFHRTVGEKLGFKADGVVSFRMDLKGPQYMDNALVTNLLGKRYLPRLAAVPGVLRAAISNPTIPTDRLVGGYITVEDHASDTPDGTYVTIWHSVSPEYFATLGIPLLAGHTFTAEEAVSDRVIVSSAMAQQQWPGQNPLGKRIKQDARAVATEPWMTVVGVVGEVVHGGIHAKKPPGPDIYMSVLQFPLRLPLTINFLVQPQSGVATADLQGALHREMQAIDPELPEYDMSTLEEHLARQTAQLHTTVHLLLLLAAAALLQALAGLAALRPSA
jgi:predicted permease